MMNYKILFLTTFVLLFTAITFAQKDDIPAKPDPPRLVNDFTHLFSVQEQYQLEHKLVEFNDSTSCQIVVVTIADLKGNDPYDYASRLGRKWGVGLKGKSNGIVILIKPSTNESKGQVFIAPGYGMEGVVPDATASDIVQNEIIPRFKQGKMFEGVDAAVNVLIALNKGEFKANQYSKAKHKRKTSGGSGIIIALVILVIIIVISRKSNNSQHMTGSGGGLPFWLLMGGLMGGGGGRSEGSFGDFQSGDNDFGGFGGGDFGGGGAGGSW